MKVTTDACLFGAWIVNRIYKEKIIVNHCLDVGTGTGLLSLMFAQRNHETIIDSVETDEDSYQQAKENADALSFKNNINVIHTDVRTYQFKHKYDLIICNPPFYENELKSGSIKKNIAHHNEGLLLDELLSIIKKNLNHTGRFYLLLPFKRNEEIKRLLEKHELSLLQMTYVKQSFFHDHFRIMLTGQLNSGISVNADFDELSIWDENKKYTTEFAELLKSYYLYL